MIDQDKHEGGCLCGNVRYQTYGSPERSGVCHCRYCQLRTGSSFGISIYFKEENVKVISGVLNEYSYQTESLRSAIIRFCSNCGSSLFWQVGNFKGFIGVAGGSFDPPTFWYEINREVFCRSGAPFISSNIKEKYQTHPDYQPVKKESDNLKGRG